MKTILVKCIVVAGILLLAIGIAARLLLDATPDIRGEAQTTETAVQPLYTLTEYNGKIALYKKGYAMPVEIFDVYVSSLPQSDRELLTQGIDASNDDEAQRLIEDYTS